MFEFINHDGNQNTMRGISSFLISLVVHGAILGVIVVVPLIFCNVLQPEELVTFLLDTPPLPVPPTPPLPPTSGNAKPRDLTTKGSIDYVPPGIPQEILRNTEGVPDDDGSAPFRWDRGMNEIGIATQEAGDKSVISNYISSLKLKELPIPKRPKKPEPLPVIGRLQESKLIYKVSPAYPDLALRTRTSGIVILEAIIDEEGNVSRLAIVSGHPLLVNAARDAVRQWKYSPTILNGEPMPVIARITLAFRIR